MQIYTSSVTEVTPAQPQQPGRIDNKIWRKWLTDLINQLFNYKGVCRTDPATRGCISAFLFLTSGICFEKSRLQIQFDTTPICGFS